MNDKNLLERLGIIQRVDIDGEEETPNAATDIATKVNVKASDVFNNSETAAEITPEVVAPETSVTSSASLRFIPNPDELIIDELADVVADKPEQEVPQEIDAELEVNAGDMPSIDDIIEEPATYEAVKMPELVGSELLMPASEPELENIMAEPEIAPETEPEMKNVTAEPENTPEAELEVIMSEPVPEPEPEAEVQISNESLPVYAEPEEITLPVIDRQAIYAQYAQEETMAAQQTETDDAQYLDTERYASISDLYKTYGKKLGGTDTIFIVDAFAKSLPDSLSINLKRQSVLNIISASNINLEELVADGLSRIDHLNSFLSVFKQHTDQLTSAREEKIAQLERQIKALKREVKERNRLQEKQEASIDFETQKIKSSLEFIANSDDFGE